MYCGRDPLHDARVVMDDLGQRLKQLVVQEALLAILRKLSYLFLLVYAHHKHGDISRRGRDDDPFGSSLQVSPSLLQCNEDTSGLHNKFSTNLTPFDVSEISLREDRGRLSTNDKFLLRPDCAIELSMGGIILDQVDHVFEANKAVIDRDNIYFARVKSSLDDQTPNTVKVIYLGLHHHVSGTQLFSYREGQRAKRSQDFLEQKSKEIL